MSSNLKKKALFPAVAMAVASVIALSSISYAWFTMGDNADLEKLDVQVKTASGMQISMDGSTWKSTLTAADIKTGAATSYAANLNQFPETDMMPVSTVGKVTTGKLDMFAGAISNAMLTATKETDAKKTGGNYFAFDLFFNMSSGKDLFLESGSQVAFKTADKGTQLSSRVAFLNLGAAVTPADARLLQGTGLDKADYIWEPNAAVRSKYAADNGAIAGKLNYKGVNAAISTAIDPNGESAALTEVSTTKHPLTFGISDNEAKILSLKSGINKVRVYIWLEGQDIDCNNDVSVDGLSTTLKFVQKDIVVTP